MHHPEGGTAGTRTHVFVNVRQGQPELPRGEDQLPDLLGLFATAVRALVAGVQRQPEDTDRVGLAHPEERCRHREVGVDPCERQGL